MNKNGQFSLTLKCDTNAMYLASFLSNYVILILNYKIVHEKVSKIFVIFKSIFCLKLNKMPYKCSIEVLLIFV